jgi:ACS family hexuronate transporter-like MFS transporter
MFLLACGVVPIFFVTKVGLWPAIALIGLAGAAHQAWAAIVFTTVSDIFPKSAVASVTGIAGMAGAFGGMIFPVVTGKILDFFAAGKNISQGYDLLFAICAFAYLIAFAVNHLLSPSFENISSRSSMDP